MLICTINIMNKYGKQRLDDLLLEKNMRWYDMVALMVLERIPGASQQLLGKFLQTDKSNVTRLMCTLENKGYVARRKNPKDNRCNFLYLSKKGEKVIPWLKQVMSLWENEVYEGIYPEDLEVYKNVSAIINNNVVGGKTYDDSYKENTFMGMA